MCLHDALTNIISQDNQEVFIEFIDKYQSQTFNCRCSNTPNDIKLFSLFESAENNAIKILKYLLQFDLCNKANNYKNTPLHLAARNGHKEIVNLLLEANADPNKERDDKWTPLHLAARHGYKEIVELLLKANANPNQEKNDKWTPLHLAANNDHKEIVNLLLEANADPNKENDDKVTPLYYAAREKHKEIFIMLCRKTDPKYRNSKSILEYMRNIKYDPNELNFIFILQSYEFDSSSLFAKDYLRKDMTFLILKKAKNEKLFKDSEEIIYQ